MANVWDNSVQSVHINGKATTRIAWIQCIWKMHGQRFLQKRRCNNRRKWSKEIKTTLNDRSSFSHILDHSNSTLTRRKVPYNCHSLPRTFLGLFMRRSIWSVAVRTVLHLPPSLHPIAEFRNWSLSLLHTSASCYCHHQQSQVNSIFCHHIISD